MVCILYHCDTKNVLICFPFPLDVQREKSLIFFSNPFVLQDFHVDRGDCRCFSYDLVALGLHFVVARESAVFLFVVVAVQRDISDRRSGTPSPMFGTGLGLGQQFGTGHRNNDRPRGSCQQDGYNAHHNDRPGMLDVLLVLITTTSGHFQDCRAQNGLKAVPAYVLRMV